MKRIKYPLLLLAAVLLPGTALAQVAPGATILQLTPDARSAGMAGTGLGMVGNASAAIFHNPSTLAFTPEMMGVSYSYSSFGTDNTLQAASAFYKIGREGKQGVMAAYRHLRESRYAGEASTDNFHPRAWDLEAAYFNNVANHLSLALTFRYLHARTLPDLGSKGTVAFDLGATYHRNMRYLDGMSSWSVGFQAANLGPKLDGGKLPARLGLGGGVDLPFSMEHRVQVGVDLDYLLPSEIRHLQAGIGAEYYFLSYGVVRAGYRFGDKEKGAGNYGTVGCGFVYLPLTLNFSYALASRGSFMRDTWQISVAVAL
ncbi:MAG: PorV/PorQ family protein [Mediterranea sp.]|jgi:hypothetical protein|nr:PorV/PorQ family protein [Mediterranea sp.]